MVRIHRVQRLGHIFIFRGLGALQMLGACESHESTNEWMQCAAEGLCPFVVGE